MHVYVSAVVYDVAVTAGPPQSLPYVVTVEVEQLVKVEVIVVVVETVASMVGLLLASE